MRIAMLCLGCLLLIAAAPDAVKEPATGLTFSPTLDVNGVQLACTGVDVRTKFLFKIYAVGHYGDPKAWSTKDKPEDRLKEWIAAPASKAFVLKFTYDVTKDQIDQRDTRMAIIRWADTPMRGDQGEGLRQRLPDARTGPHLDLGPGWEPCWTRVDLAQLRATGDGGGMRATNWAWSGEDGGLNPKSEIRNGAAN